MSLIYSWKLPTTNTDGTPIKARGKGSLVETVVSFGRIMNGVPSILENRQVRVPRQQTEFSPSQPGIYFVRAFVRNTYGRKSVLSDQLTVTC